MNLESATAITINANGMQFDAFVEGPANAELILLLHGFPQFADSWLPIMHALANTGFRAAAVNQRGYSSAARPELLAEYAIEKLVQDVQTFADALHTGRFHLVGHDWGAFVAWVYGATFPERLLSLTALSTPHPDAFLNAIENDADQKMRSQYIALFRAPGGATEKLLEANEYALLRRSYQGKIPDEQIQRNVTRLSKPGALTAALNWYRALKMDERVGKVNVPTLYIWGSTDLALGRTAAFDTANFVEGPYSFVELPGKSHWLLEEVPQEIREMIHEHTSRNRA